MTMKKVPVFGLLTALIVALSAVAVGGLIAQDDGEEDVDVEALLEERGVTVLPLDVVTESAEQILDLTPTSARLNFIGTIPLACTIVFGTTTDFGNAAIDTDMNGGAIIEHNPLMLNLEPDTEYFFRVQGSGEDGTFYMGAIMSFRTPPASDELPDNLLSPQRGAEVVGVSSNFGGAANDEVWGVLGAFDDNLNTEWSSDGDGDDAWFEVALGETSQVNLITFETRAMTDGTAQILTFMITDDAGNEYGPFAVPEPGEIGEYEVDFVTSSVRFDVVESTSGNTGIVEIALLGEAVESE